LGFFVILALEVGMSYIVVEEPIVAGKASLRGVPAETLPARLFKTLRKRGLGIAIL
jgi:hypothetical protein